MAKILGEPARYLSAEHTKKLRYMFLFFLFILLFGWITGYVVGSGNLYWLLSWPILLIAYWIAYKEIKELDKQRLDLRKGAVGEAIVSYILESFPDDFRVIHDLSTAHGNLDHVVIGPTGVFAVDAKNWRGVITADGNDEILLNGKPTDKPAVKNFMRNIMCVKEKVKTLSNLETYFHGLLVFTSARVEANWGKTGSVNCITDEQLYDYIVEDKKGKTLSEKEIDSISQAFLALARMDKVFAE